MRSKSFWSIKTWLFCVLFRSVRFLYLFYHFYFVYKFCRTLLLINMKNVYYLSVVVMLNNLRARVHRGAWLQLRRSSECTDRSIHLTAYTWTLREPFLCLSALFIELLILCLSLSSLYWYSLSLYLSL
jgi:hypothetical protein